MKKVDISFLKNKFGSDRWKAGYAWTSDKMYQLDLRKFLIMNEDFEPKVKHIANGEKLDWPVWTGPVSSFGTPQLYVTMAVVILCGDDRNAGIEWHHVGHLDWELASESEIESIKGVKFGTMFGIV